MPRFRSLRSWSSMVPWHEARESDLLNDRTVRNDAAQREAVMYAIGGLADFKDWIGSRAGALTRGRFWLAARLSFARRSRCPKKASCYSSTSCQSG